MPTFSSAGLVVAAVPEPRRYTP